MKRRDRLAILLLLGFGLILAGCGGTSGSGGGRSLSGVVDEDEKQGREAQRESRTRGDESRSRTRTDHQQNDAYEYESYDEDEDDGSGGILLWALGALFSGGDDDEEYEEPVQYQEYVPSGPYAEDEIGGEDMESSEGADLSVGRFALGYRQSWSHVAGDAIEGFDTGMVGAGFGPKDRTKLYLGVYFGSGDFERSDVGAALDDLTEEGLEVGVRVYFTPDHTLIGPYINFGGRIGSIDWKYRDPVEVVTEDGGVTRVTEDWVLDGGPFVGLGVSILQTRHLHLGASFMTGIRFTAGETDEGLANDLFQDVGWYQWNLEGSIRF